MGAEYRGGDWSVKEAIAIGSTRGKPWEGAATAFAHGRASPLLSAVG
jgi:hypothetical protein